ncbi:MAG: twin-arginine translocase subunit TatC [Deltaproteobacteria bacterium]|nr:twin-arginine translocase subunit TatC [Deltaproteobacteria bacterium]
MSEQKLTLTQHLQELRTCLIRSVVTIVVGMGVSLYFSKSIFRLLQKPLLTTLPWGSHFIATSPLEAWTTYLKVSLLTGFFLSLPVIFYQLWSFIAPGLYRNEKKIAFLFVAFSTLFFVGGGFFGYFVIFPIGFKFFVTALEGTDITLLPVMKDYLGFIIRMLFIFGLIFETPLILVLLAQIGIVNRRQLASARRYLIVLAFLIAGVLTPGPDVVSQLLLALPLLGLYEISLIVIRLIEKKK